MTEDIREFSGVKIGSIETSGSGDKTVRNYYGQILGYYRKSQNVTVDFYGRIIWRGDMASALLIYKQ